MNIYASFDGDSVVRFNTESSAVNTFPIPYAGDFAGSVYGVAAMYDGGVAVLQQAEEAYLISKYSAAGNHEWSSPLLMGVVNYNLEGHRMTVSPDGRVFLAYRDGLYVVAADGSTAEDLGIAVAPCVIPVIPA